VRRYAEFALALALDVVGAGVALLLSLQSWQTVTTARAGRTADVLDVSGRTVDGASTAFALVALAGVVAVLATRRVLRRAVGVLVALAGAGLVWRAALAFSPVSAARARALVRSKHETVSTSGVVPHVDVHSVWPVLSLVCGLLVLASGVLIAWRGDRWQVMSARYEATPAAASDDQAKAAATLWRALDEGDDPT
jgi:uncharacterized membrane protein (TIGR02234 family)